MDKSVPSPICITHLLSCLCNSNTFSCFVRLLEGGCCNSHRREAVVTAIDCLFHMSITGDWERIYILNIPAGRCLDLPSKFSENDCRAGGLILYNLLTSHIMQNHSSFLERFLFFVTM